MTENRKKKFGWDNWVKDLNKQRSESSSYDLNEIVSQLEKSDYSSLDPDVRKEIEERERREKHKKVAVSKEKETTI